MAKKDRDITILAIGDKQDFDAYRKFHRRRALLIRQGFKYVTISYRDLLQAKLPSILTKRVIIFLFFPFSYWNKYIEHRGYKGLYGNVGFSIKFSSFWNKVSRIIKQQMPDKEVLFINRPFFCGLYRDKLSVIRRLQRHKVSQPRLYNIPTVKQAYKLINSGHNIFVKPRCGSLGKGMSYLNWENWMTNFTFRGNKILSRISDRGWKFRQVKQNNLFLNRLIRSGLLFQEAVDSVLLDNFKIDLRIYTFFNRVIYSYPRKNKADKITTNISQGGRGDPSILELLPKRQAEKARRIAAYASKVLKLNISGIDVMLDRNLRDVYIVDVNVFPGFPRSRAFDMVWSIAKNLARICDRNELF
ncbi:MAG: hypothetical protein ISS45_06370 [Candidatus Omnitrophica bacterium]|nr:hypothetical protein [Candidatus Omnitrophota bacterium]